MGCTLREVMLTFSWRLLIGKMDLNCSTHLSRPSYCENTKVIKKNPHQHVGFLFVFDIKVCGHEMLAHRAVLACCSPYLFEIFNTDSDCHGVSHVKFDDLNPEAVEVLLNYAYTAQ